MPLDSRRVQDDKLNPIQMVGLVDPSGNYYARVDSIVNALNSIDVYHHEIHEGEAYLYSDILEAVADDAFADIVILTSTKQVHIDFEGSGGGDFYGSFYENPVYDTDGSAVNPVAWNRNNVIASTVSLILSPTVSDIGTVLINKYFPGCVTGRAVGASGSSRHEFVLPPNGVYLARITNKAGGAKTLGFAITWYEEDV